MGRPGEVGGRMVSTAHLVPYIERRADLHVPEDVEEYMEDNMDQGAVEENSDAPNGDMAPLNDDDLHDEVNDEGPVEEERVPLTDGIRQRPQRNVRRPSWLDDFNTGKGSQDREGRVLRLVSQ